MLSEERLVEIYDQVSGSHSRALGVVAAEVARKTLQDAADEVLAIISQPSGLASTERNYFRRWHAEWLRTRAASISADKAGDPTSVVEALSKATGLPPTRIHTDRHPLDMD